MVTGGHSSVPGSPSPSHMIFMHAKFKRKEEGDSLGTRLRESFCALFLQMEKHVNEECETQVKQCRFPGCSFKVHIQHT